MKRVGSQKIGILGGTFNPIHIGHLLIAQDAMEQARLDRVVFIPAASPAHKSATGLAPARCRLQMVKLAIRGNDRFTVDDIEIRRGGKSYAVDTVTELKRRWPRSELFFIIGADSLQELHLWCDIGRLAELCTFVTVARPGFDWRVGLQPDGTHRAGKSRLDWSRALQMVLGGKAVRNIRRHIILGHLCDIASRDIRARIACGQSTRYLVPNAVLNYIEREKLYQ